MTVRIKVVGKVQGVYYRVSTRNQAKMLGLTGFVKNENDGSVMIIASGKEHHITELLHWCKTGVQMAKVAHITHEILENKEFSSFEIQK